jgi:hypothetical protein
MYSELVAGRVWYHLLRGSIIAFLGLVVLSCGDEPNEDLPPEGIDEIEVASKTDDCFISNGGTAIQGDHLANIRLIARSPCRKVDGLFVEDVPGVTSLWFLSGITSVKQSLWIERNPSLETLEGLDSLRRAEEIRIVSNPSLVSLNGLESLTELTAADDPLVPPLSPSGVLEIHDNDELRSLSGLENLTKANVVLISHCRNLQSIEALYQLESLQSLKVINSPVPRCQIDELISRLDGEPEFVDIAGVGTGDCQ